MPVAAPERPLAVVSHGSAHAHEVKAKDNTPEAMISAPGPESRVSFLWGSQHFCASPIDFWLLVEKPRFHKYFSPW